LLTFIASASSNPCKPLAYSY